MFRYCILIFALAATASASAQDAELLQRWQADQAAAIGRVTEFQFHEFSDSAVEGGSGMRHITVETGISIDPGDQGVQRQIQEIRVNGRPYERRPGSERRAESSRSRDGRPRSGQPVRDDILTAADALLFPGRMIRRMKPTGRSAREDDAGQTVIRIETVPESPEPNVERISIWVSAENGRLVRTRAVLLGGERGTVVVDTRYQRIQGVDLPESRTLEGSMSMRRRMRTFTVLVTSSARYTEHLIQSE